MALQPHQPAPYTTSIAATTIMDAFRNRGLGLPITIDVVIRAGVQESLARRTLQSLRLLDLINEEGKPTQQFEDFRLTRGEDEYRARLQEWLRNVYADVLQYCDPSSDSQSKVEEAFRGYEPDGQRRGMALLLIGLWRYAGLETPETTKSSSERKSAPRPARSPNAPRWRVSVPQRADVQARGRAPITSGTPNGLPPALVGLLQQIPGGGAGWSSAQREAFLSAFTAVLDYVVPITEADQFQVNDSPNEEVAP